MFKNKLDFELIEYKKSKNKLSLKIKGIEKGSGEKKKPCIQLLYNKVKSTLNNQ